MVPKGSNSGIYLMGEYEVQILDSFGKRTTSSTRATSAALYSAAAPKKNAARSRASGRSSSSTSRPRSSTATRRSANAKFVKVTLNDEVLHENVEMKSRRPAG